MTGADRLRYWDIRDAHDSLVGKPGHTDIEPGQVFDNSALGLAAQHPFLVLSHGEAFRDPWEKAAVAIRIITQRHVFDQGNKRTAWLYAVTLLGQFGHEMPEEVTFDYVRSLMIAVTTRRLDDPAMIAGCLLDFYMGRYDTSQPFRSTE
jgi:prophage maintenance system killer protein